MLLDFRIAGLGVGFQDLGLNLGFMFVIGFSRFVLGVDFRNLLFYVLGFYRMQN